MIRFSKILGERNLGILYEMIQEISKHSGSTKKAEILEVFLTRFPGLYRLILAACNPFRVYNLSVAAARAYSGPRLDRCSFRSFGDLLEALKERKISGNEAKQEWNAFLSELTDAGAIDAAERILDKDLKCGIGISTINKVLQKTPFPPIATFNVALGTSWKGEKVWENEDEDWYVSRKLDGVRCLAYIGGGRKPVLYSRQGRVFTTLGVLEEKLSRYQGLPIVLDGELAIETDGGADDFQGIMKQIRKKDHSIERPVYHVFDILSQIETKASWSERQLMLKSAVLKGTLQGIRPVEQGLITCEETFERWMKESDDNNWEGLILRKDAPHKPKRSKDIYKVKLMHDAEYTVVDVIHGKMAEPGGSNQTDILSAAVIEHKGNRVKVGSGWSWADRLKYHEHPDQLIGKIITVQYFEETRNQNGEYSLRFPVCKTIHGDKRTT